jgi:hypothetical protein
MTYNKPSRKAAKQMDKICREEGGFGLNEVNVIRGRTIGVNAGSYQGWFCGPNRGYPFDDQLRDRVAARVELEVKPR